MSEFPKIWRTFKAKDPSSGNLVEYRIQDIPEEHFDTVLDHSVQHYLKDEPKAKALKYLDDTTSVNEFVEAVRNTLPKKLSIGCFKEGSSELIGFHPLYIHHKNDPPAEIEGQARKIHHNLTKTGLERANIFDKYKVDRILGELGLSVDPSHRRLGIATELLKARLQVAKENELKVTAGGFCGIAAQKAARKAGFVDEHEITADQLPELGINQSINSEEDRKESFIVMSGILD